MKASNLHGFQGSIVWTEWLSRSLAHHSTPLGQFSIVVCARAATPAAASLCRGVPPGRPTRAASLWAAAPRRAQCIDGECVWKQGRWCIHRGGSSFKNSFIWYLFVVTTADSDFSNKVKLFSGSVRAPAGLPQVGKSCLQPLLILLNNNFCHYQVRMLLCDEISQFYHCCFLYIPWISVFVVFLGGLEHWQ